MLIMTNAWLISYLTILGPLWPWLFPDQQFFLLTRFTQPFFIFRSKSISDIHFTNSLDEFKIGQDSDRHKVMASKMAENFYLPLFFNMRNIWETGPDS